MPAGPQYPPWSWRGRKPPRRARRGLSRPDRVDLRRRWYPGPGSGRRGHDRLPRWSGLFDEEQAYRRSGWGSASPMLEDGGGVDAPSVTPGPAGGSPGCPDRRRDRVHWSAWMVRGERPTFGSDRDARSDGRRLRAGGRDDRPDSHRLSEHRGRVVVIVFVGTSCPIGDLYLPRLIAMADSYRRAASTSLAIDSNASEPGRGRRRLCPQRPGANFPFLKDSENRVADALLAERTCEAIVVDRRGRLRYRGAIDDQYTPGRRRDAPRNDYLAGALEAVLGGRAVAPETTTVAGCPIERTAPSVPPRAGAPRCPRAGYLISDCPAGPQPVEAIDRRRHTCRRRRADPDEPLRPVPPPQPGRPLPAPDLRAGPPLGDVDRGCPPGRPDASLGRRPRCPRAVRQRPEPHAPQATALNALVGRGGRAARGPVASPEPAPVPAGLDDRNARPRFRDARAVPGPRRGDGADPPNPRPDPPGCGCLRSGGRGPSGRPRHRPSCLRLHRGSDVSLGLGGVCEHGAGRLHARRASHGLPAGNRQAAPPQRRPAFRGPLHADRQAPLRSFRPGRRALHRASAAPGVHEGHPQSQAAHPAR